jgi:hypothetical protein
MGVGRSSSIDIWFKYTFNKFTVNIYPNTNKMTAVINVIIVLFFINVLKGLQVNIIIKKKAHLMYLYIFFKKNGFKNK